MERHRHLIQDIGNGHCRQQQHAQSFRFGSRRRWVWYYTKLSSKRDNRFISNALRVRFAERESLRASP